MMSKVALPIVLTGYKYKTETIIAAINEHKCSHVMMVPAMTVDILNYVDKHQLDMPSLTGER